MIISTVAVAEYRSIQTDLPISRIYFHQPLPSFQACMVETDESTAETEDHIPEETITFLYKLSPGACPKSYGFNAARLAGIPKEITRRAQQISRNLEKEATCVRAFKDLMKMEHASGVREMLAALSI